MRTDEQPAPAAVDDAPSKPREASASRIPLRGKWRLFVLTFLMLFVELGLIRYSAENVLYLNFLSNLVLIASFLGIGIGFLRAGKARAGRGLLRAPIALATLVAVFVLLPALQVLHPTRDIVVGGHFGMPAIPAFIYVPLVFIVVAMIMAMIAEGVGVTFAEFEPLEAYRLDILGSIAGILVFSAMSFLGARPIVWALIVGLGFILVLGMRRKGILIALASMILVLGVLSFWPGNVWSPYYRLTLERQHADGQMSIKANSRPHQTIVPVDKIESERPFYLFPYQYVDGTPKNVLIIGAGSGTDVSLALSKGVEHIDAVEIDPALQQIGEKYNRAQPYQDPRVDVHINDGRAFLEQSDEQYDLIMLALPDSLTLVGGQGSLRLENYLFTTEAITSMKDHLAPGGVFSMYNYYGPVSLDRNGATMHQVFGQAPCVDIGPSGAGTRQMAAFTAPRDGTLECTATADATAGGGLSTDDHPFPYLASRTIPGLYLVVIAMIVAISLVAVRTTAGPLRQMRPFLDLFFMGSAFLLLETTNVVKFALLFGTTWLVNSLVFTGVLLAVLAAVSLAKRVKLPHPGVLYSLLLASLAVAWLVPASALLSLSFWPRFILAILVAFTPIFLANLVFAQRFKDVAGSSTMAFGANLLGAMLGGVLEYGALVTGYRTLLIVAALLYGLAFLSGRTHLKAGATETVAA